MSRTIYKCRDCKARFEEPVREEYTERYEYWGATFSQKYVEDSCPECGSDLLDEIWEDAYDEDIDGEDEEDKEEVVKNN